MLVKVRIPTPLHSLTSGAAEVEASGATVREVIEDLNNRYNGFKERICDSSGELRQFVNLFVNDEDIRFLKGLDTELKDKDEISIIPAIAGGC